MPAPTFLGVVGNCLSLVEREHFEYIPRCSLPPPGHSGGHKKIPAKGFLVEFSDAGFKSKSI